MHAAERENLIIALLQKSGFVSFQELDREIDASPATIRRDLDRLERSGVIVRVHGGARIGGAESGADTPPLQLKGTPFEENISRNRAQKEAIGRAAAQLCEPGESIIIDGGTTTLQMCPFLESLRLSVLTNSLHIVSALMTQQKTRISVPAGAVYREQNIILSPYEDDGVSQYRASKLFMGAAAIGPHGVMQTDVVLVQAERKMFERADKTIVLVDSSKFRGGAGLAVLELSLIDTVITDDGISPADAKMLEREGVELITVSV